MRFGWANLISERVSIKKRKNIARWRCLLHFALHCIALLRRLHSTESSINLPFLRMQLCQITYTKYTEFYWKWLIKCSLLRATAFILYTIYSILKNHSPNAIEVTLRMRADTGNNRVCREWFGERNILLLLLLLLLFFLYWIYIYILSSLWHHRHSHNMFSKHCLHSFKLITEQFSATVPTLWGGSIFFDRVKTNHENQIAQHIKKMCSSADSM